MTRIKRAKPLRTADLRVPTSAVGREAPGPREKANDVNTSHRHIGLVFTPFAFSRRAATPRRRTFRVQSLNPRNPRIKPSLVSLSAGFAISAVPRDRDRSVTTKY